MIKKFAIASAIAMAAIGLTAGAANAAPPTAPTPGALAMHSDTQFNGEFAVLSEGVLFGTIVAGVPQCTEAPLHLGNLDTRSAILGTVTQIKRVEFYSGATCATATRVATLRAGDQSAIADSFATPGTAVAFKAFLTVS